MSVTNAKPYHITRGFWCFPRMGLLIRALGVCLMLCMFIHGRTTAHAFATGGAGICLQIENPDQIGIETRCDGLELLLTSGIQSNSVFCGLASFRWGPGRSGSLMMSGKVPPMPVAGYTLNYDKSEYIRFIGRMEPDGKRRIVGHRLQYAPNTWLQLGISETAILSDKASPGMYWPFPGLPLYALQHVVNQQDRSQSSHININLGLDFRFFVQPRAWAILRVGSDATIDGEPSCTSLFEKLSQESIDSTAKQRVSSCPEIYGELFIDDAQGCLQNRDFVPDLIGGLIGVQLPRLLGDDRWALNIEYVAVANYVYSSRNPVNNYVFRDILIGHPLGPDSDMVIATMKFRPDTMTEFVVSSSIERHGEGKIGNPWTSGTEKNDIFLSGIVERTMSVKCGFRRALARPFYVWGCVEAAAASNHEHRAGANWRHCSAEVGLGIQL